MLKNIFVKKKTAYSICQYPCTELLHMFYILYYAV